MTDATSNNKTMENKNKKAPPPARITQANYERAKEMMDLINALPESEEKAALMMSEQVSEWDYHLTTCSVRQYTHKPTEKEKMEGKTITPEGVEIKLRSKGTWCPHCQCSAQEWKRHKKTKKCISNRAKAQPHLRAIEKKAEATHHGILRGAGQKQILKLNKETQPSFQGMVKDENNKWHYEGCENDPPYLNIEEVRTIIATLNITEEEGPIVIAEPEPEKPKKKTKKLKLKKRKLNITVTE